jgi:hypothetical protein
MLTLSSECYPRRGDYSSFKSYPSFPNQILNKKNRKNFRIWKTRLTYLVLKKIGKNVDDLPDNNYWELFVNNFSSEEISDMICNKDYNIWLNQFNQILYNYTNNKIFSEESYFKDWFNDGISVDIAVRIYIIVKSYKYLNN